MSQKSIATYTVIGSGPVGISVTTALLRKGKRVLLIDGGESLDEGTNRKLETARQLFSEYLPSAEQNRSFIHTVKSNVEASNKGVEIKRTYGSDYPYRKADQQIHPESSLTGQITPSLAVGGYSNVWGAAVLPYTKDDIIDWPISYSELVEGYQQVVQDMRVSGADSDFEGIFPKLNAPNFPLTLSKQAEKIRATLERSRFALTSKNLAFGAARLSFRQSLGREFSSQDECTQCGLCMYGCPHELIYSSRHALILLKRKFPNQLTHLPGIIVDRLEERTYDTLIFGKETELNLPRTIRTKNVFLAAGALASTRILLHSFGDFSTTLQLKVSEYFMLPLLGPRYDGDLNLTPQHTLAQLFLELQDKNISQRLIHLQLYTYNDLYKKGLESMFGRLSKLTTPLLRRLHIIQGYLHSENSSTIGLKIHSKQDPRLVLTGNQAGSAKRIIQKVAIKMLKLSPHTGLLPLIPMLSIGKPGDGRHVGGTFPMSKEDKPYSTDLLGRPRGSDKRLERVFLADSANFTSIPAPTITLSAMANGTRIASIVADMDDHQSADYNTAEGAN